MNGVLFLCFAACLTSGVFAMAMIRAGLGDVPEKRSSHRAITPTGGGVALVAGLAAATFFLPFILPLVISGNASASQYAQIMSLLWAAAMLGLMDDVYNIRSGVKFLIIFVLSFVGVWIVGPLTYLPIGLSAALTHISLPFWAGVAGSILWIFVVTNIVNFMDGANGMMIGVMGAASLGLAYFGLVYGAIIPALTLLFLAASLAGLIPYNFRPRAKIFAGDVGALFTGYGYGLCALWICMKSWDGGVVYIAPVLILPFLTDSLLTMLRRALKKEKLMTAHNSHLYQRLIRTKLSHVQVSLIYMAIVIGLIFYSKIMLDLGHVNKVIYWAVPTVILSILYVLTGRYISGQKNIS